ncbi:hypothetical protein ABEB36_000433 [Hypothenemus hampei]|uniref:Transposable element P transposase n=1 Tax=Hypothenemus hampei TaxID=57062 RepID=A0ABD1FB71_HYPHA
MDIKPNVHYVKGDDVIMGFVHSDTGERKMANKALVFMLQGLTTKWKQPVTFYLTHTSNGSELLVTYIHEVLDAAINIAKLDVVATICDMSTINVKCMKELGSSLNRPFFVSNGKTIHTMFDPPHLLKCSASLFRKHNVNLPVEVEGKHDMMTAKFKDIVSAYNIDKNNPLVFRTLYKLKDTHLEPVMKFAMKVSVAAQVMSNTVGCYLYSLLSRGELEPRTLATATFVQQMDELFDSFNGNQLKPSVKVLKCAITDDSPHLTYWEKAYGIVNSWKYERINKKGHLMKGKPPSQIGWLTSLKAIRNIWLYVRSKGVTSLPPRRLNQDSLENAFGTIRNGCGSSDHPTTCQFISSLKTYIINGMTSQIKGNCEDDNSSLLTNMRSFLDVPLPIREPLHTDQPLPNTSYHELFTDVAESVALGQSNVLSVAYVSGFIAKRVLSIVNCDICKINLCLEQGLHNTFIWYKECNYEVQRFTYPSENLTTFVGMSVTALETFMEGYRGQKGLSQQAFCLYKPNCALRMVNLHHA